MGAFELVSDRRHLAEVVERALSCSCVGIDTEFFWEDTFYPQLALVQLSLPDGAIFLIDPLELRDLSLLGLVLVAPAVVKVLHDGVQDLINLRRASGCSVPRAIFDTRLAAGFGGAPSTHSLAALCERILGVALDKGAQRSNWLERPIPAARLDYAAADVRHLIPLHDALWVAVAEHHNERRLREELCSLEDPAQTTEGAPEQRYLRIKGRGKLDGAALAALQALTALREREARRLDLPRGRVISDGVLLAIAKRMPSSERALAEVRDITRRQLSRLGSALLEAVESGRRQPLELDPLAPTTNGEGPSSDTIAERMVEGLEALASTEGVDPALVASRAQLRNLVKYWPDPRPSESALLEGWRGELLGPLVRQVLDS